MKYSVEIAVFRDLEENIHPDKATAGAATLRYDSTLTGVINPVTGRAYEYGDPTPTSYNDPLYPQLNGNISPYPYDPSRYLNPRTIRGSLSFRF